MRATNAPLRSPPLPAKQTPDVTMKKAYMTTTIAAVAGVAVVCSSCAYPNVGYSSYTVPGTVSAGVAWSNASYDASGFPIFGYSYGRPVYGYTSAGEAVFTIAALTALCFVPYWGPASWYHGPYYYPRGIHRVPAPPRFPAGHAPGVRPPHGIVPPPAPRPSIPSHRQPGHPPISTMPMPVGSGGRTLHPHTSVPRPGRATVHPNGSVHFPKPSGVPASPTTVVRPQASVAPKNNGVSTMPMPLPAGGSSLNKPTISTMPIPAGGGAGASKPSGSTMPTRGSSGSFSIPKPSGVSAPPTRIIRSSSGSGRASFSPAQTRGGFGIPRSH